MAEPLLQVDSLSRTFDVSKPWLNRVIEREERRLLRAVKEVSFSVKRGQTFALVGESGCGKSTLARMVVGLIAPSVGQIQFEGKPVVGEHGPDFRRRIQMIFQDPFASLNPRWRVDRIIAEPIRTLGLMTDTQQIAERVGELLTLVGLDPLDGAKYPHEFSGGQRQRIAIARALSSEPEFIVCDEPTSALDVSVQAQILNLMRDLQDRLSLTYLMISHDLAVVRHMADDIGVMYLGRLVEVAETEALFNNPQHPYTKLLLEAVPDLDRMGLDRTPVGGEMPNPITPPPGCTFHPRCPLRFEGCDRNEPELQFKQNRHVACHAVT